MCIKNSIRHAFSMLELVFVIIILGIVASIGSEIIADAYDSYIVSRGQFRASIKTELALNQIANRLRYAIPGTVGYRRALGQPFQNLSGTTNVPATATVLQWVGYDGDSFEAINTGAGASNRRPGWSGFCDIDAPTTTTTNLHTPGSNLNLASTIIGNLGGSIANAQIYFPDGTNYGVAATGTAGEDIALDAPIPQGNDIYERYKLAWTSYALSVEGGDLYLYYNFSPLVPVGTALIPANAQKSLLMEGVDNFRFKVTEGAIRIKICKAEDTFDINDSVHACKEKVIF